ncbi:signal recognition particle protein [Arthrobacter sp. Hiyo8]|nr:signal recognition particle protein [Arthrobacter sp. Hiyo8]
MIVDTAGRLGVDAEMMDQARRIRQAIIPNEVLFVIDSMIGQDAVNTAVAFDEGVNFTGVVLSKLDGDAAVVPRSRSRPSPASRSCSHPPAKAWTTSNCSTRTAWLPASSTWVTFSP